MLTWILIVTPIFFVIAGALAALTLSSPAEETRSEESATEIRVPTPRAVMRAGLELGPPVHARDDDALAALEAHLRRERTVAASFARDPSHETLWMN